MKPRIRKVGIWWVVSLPNRHFKAIHHHAYSWPAALDYVRKWYKPAPFVPKTVA